MDFFMSNIEKIIGILGCLYLIFSVVATLTPTKKDDKILSKIGRIFDKLGFNPRLFFDKGKKKKNGR